MKILLLLLFINLLLLDAQASCFTDLDFLVRNMLKAEMQFSGGAEFFGKNQKITFQYRRFSHDLQEMVIETIDKINKDIEKSSSFIIPREVSASCNFNCSNGALYYHHIFFEVDSFATNSSLNLIEKKAIIAHEYGHLLLNRAISGDFPELFDIWKYGVEYRLFRYINDIPQAERVYLKRSELFKSFNLYPLYNSISELFADSVAVVYFKEPNIFPSLLEKIELREAQRYALPRTQSKEFLQQKLKYRSFDSSLGLDPLEGTRDIHQYFYIARQKLFPYLEKAFDDPKEKERVLANIMLASKDTLEHFYRKDLNSTAEFRNILEKINNLKYGEKLQPEDQSKFNEIIYSFNEVFMNNFKVLIN